MTPEEKTLISGLFDRIAQTSSQAKDSDAEQLIRSKVSENPSAPYMLAQSTLVLQQALANAQNRIADLEHQVSDAQAHPAPKQGGFLSGIFGGGASNPPPVPQRSVAQPPPVPYQAGSQQPYQQAAPAVAPQPQAGYQPQPGANPMGGFLSGALTTAAGVAGGALLFKGIEGLLGHNPGPFAGAAMPGGGFLNPGGQSENITEVTNNYYTEGDQNADGQSSQADPDPDPDPAQYASNDDLGSSDPDPDPSTDPSDFASDDSGFDDGGGNDDNFA
jgi:uncharacterized protein